MRIGILGGTFNPPHIGHIHAARAARDALKLDRVVFVPAYLPPHKTLPAGSAGAEQRLAMASLAAETMGAEVSDIELARGGTSYTADTLELLQKKLPGDRLWLIVGTDMFLTIQNWRAPERIFACARLAVVAREAGSREQLWEHKRELENAYGCGVDLIDADAVEISSSALRQRCAQADAYIPEPVRRYIEREGLYRWDEVKT